MSYDLRIIIERKDVYNKVKEKMATNYVELKINKTLRKRFSINFKSFKYWASFEGGRFEFFLFIISIQTYILLGSGFLVGLFLGAYALMYLIEKIIGWENVIHKRIYGAIKK